jgi:hypothetical protein
MNLKDKTSNRRPFPCPSDSSQAHSGRGILRPSTADPSISKRHSRQHSVNVPESNPTMRHRREPTIQSNGRQSLMNPENSYAFNNPSSVPLPTSADYRHSANVVQRESVLAYPQHPFPASCSHIGRGQAAPRPPPRASMPGRVYECGACGEHFSHQRDLAAHYHAIHPSMRS